VIEPLEDEVGDWLDSYAQALAGQLGDAQPEPTAPTAREKLLLLARLVAHGTERKNAPLATYVAGRYVATRAAQGVDAEQATGEALEAARAMLSDRPQGGATEEPRS
jgi:hypothetical protein